MTFNISEKKISITKLREEIDKDRLLRSYLPSLEKTYLFMNQETIDELVSIIGLSVDGLTGTENDCMCGYFHGCKVFCDNTKKYCEVEMR